MDLRTRTITTLADLTQIQDPWNALAERTAVWAPSVFQGPSWVLPAWSIAPRSARLYCIAVYRHDYLVGFAPLMRVSLHGFRVLRFIGHTHNEFNTVLTNAEDEQAVIRALVAHLHNRVNEWDALEADRCVGSLVRLSEANPLGLVHHGLATWPWLAVPLPATWDAYRQSLSYTQRAQFNKKLRRMERAGNLTFGMTGDVECLDTLIRELADLRIRSWRTRGRYATLNPLEKNPSFWACLLDACRALALSRAALVSRLQLDGRTIAMALHLLSGERIIKYMQAWDPEFEYFSPGLIENLLAIRWSIDRRLSVFDFAGDANLYKLRLGATEGTLSNALFGAPTPRGKLGVRILALFRTVGDITAGLRAEPNAAAKTRRVGKGVWKRVRPEQATGEQ